MDIERFLQERRADWDRLERLLRQAETASAQELGHERIQELLTLYRRASSDLNQARSITANAEVLGRLNQLTGRGYRYVYRGGRTRIGFDAIRRFVLFEVPATFRREVVHVVSAAGALLLGALVGALAVADDRENGRRLIPPDFYVESPAERVATIEAEEERIQSVDQATAFGAFLYTHNIRVTFLAFSLAALTVVGGWWILFFNGTLLGAVMAMYVQDGVGTFFFAWVGPHGALELPAIVFSGAAGLRMGTALFLPGDRTRSASVKAALPSVWRIMGASAAFLVAAGLIEGSFSQFSSKTAPYPLKIGVAVLLFAGLMTYLFVTPVLVRRFGAR